MHVMRKRLGSTAIAGQLTGVVPGPGNTAASVPTLSDRSWSVRADRQLAKTEHERIADAGIEKTRVEAAEPARREAADGTGESRVEEA